MMVPIQVIRWYRMQCYDGTDSCAIVVPIRRYCQLKVLRKFINEIPELDNCLIDSDYLEMSDVNMNDPKLFLYQSGYLTIKKVVGSSYMLGYPNREVRNAMLGMSLPNG